MEKVIVYSSTAPEPIGPYSQAIRIGCSELLFCSGQIAIDPGTGNLIEGGIIEQTRKALENLKSVLLQGGYSFDSVVKTTVYLSDINDFVQMNTVYEEYFSGSKPARSTLQAARLPKGALVEIDAIASL